MKSKTGNEKNLYHFKPLIKHRIYKNENRIKKKIILLNSSDLKKTLNLSKKKICV